MRTCCRILASILTGPLACTIVYAQLIDRTKKTSDPDPVAAELSLEERADIYMARKMYRQAGETYKQAHLNEPNSARIVNKLGISYHHLMLLDSARREYERAWRMDNTYSQALNNLGTVYHAQGRYRRAIRAYKRALRDSPHGASIYSNLGTSYFARHKFRNASRAYLKALELDPDVFETDGNFGTLLQERSVSNRGKYYYFMARAYAGAALYDRAILNLRKALEEGYAGPKKIARDPAFAAMHEFPAFQRLAFPEMVASAPPGLPPP